LHMPLRTAHSAAACTDWNMAGLLLSTPIMCGSAAAGAARHTTPRSG
jgi:hypothetical protein